MAEPNGGDTARRSRLLAAKLRALVADHIGVTADDLPPAAEFAPGAALRLDDDAWTFLDADPGRRLGAALAWALRAGASRLHVVAEADTGTLARRADAFEFPITVSHAEGRTLLPAVSAPLPAPPVLPAHHAAFRSVIVEAGAEPRVEHGVLCGEVRGLEVCRVVDDPHTATTRLEVGIGAHDREAFQIMHGDAPTAESLARIVDVVAEQRTPGAAPHPLNRLGAERLLRWRAIASPELVGAVVLEPAQPPLPRRSLKDPEPCVATGVGVDDRPLLAVFSVGVDLELVPYASDARHALEPGVGGGMRLVLAMPARDRVRLTDEIAGLLRQSVEIVPIA